MMAGFEWRLSVFCALALPCLAQAVITAKSTSILEVLVCRGGVDL